MSEPRKSSTGARVSRWQIDVGQCACASGGYKCCGTRHNRLINNFSGNSSCQNSGELFTLNQVRLNAVRFQNNAMFAVENAWNPDMSFPAQFLINAERLDLLVEIKRTLSPRQVIIADQCFESIRSKACRIVAVSRAFVR